MDYLTITQSQSLCGDVAISGAKNAALPLLALTLLSREDVEISNLPDVADVKTLSKLLEHLGAHIQALDSHTLSINCADIIHTKALYDIVRKMRASILVLGPLLARFRKCQVSLPGGCAIGARPVDLHLKAMEKMGAQIHIEGGYIIANAPKEVRTHLDSFGEALGLFFQVRDDLLDVLGDSTIDGKTLHNDEGKNTYVNLLGIDGARAQCEELIDSMRGCLDLLPPTLARNLLTLIEPYFTIKGA